MSASGFNIDAEIDQFVAWLNLTTED